MSEQIQLVKAEVQSIVDEMMKQREDLQMQKETEEALNNSATKINELLESLEAKDDELTEKVAKIEELETSNTELSSKIEELEQSLAQAETEKTELSERAAAVETELENIKKDRTAELRFEELKTEGVAALDEKSRSDQLAKVREMTDEEFASYKSERVELRRSVIAELEASTGGDVVDNSDTASGEDNSDNALEDGDSDTASDDVDDDVELDNVVNAGHSIDPMKAMAAALNMDTPVRKDVVSKYRELGKAMAEKYVKK
jgi:outer membrane murein-binding lipoprotein Lpp